MRRPQIRRPLAVGFLAVLLAGLGLIPSAAEAQAPADLKVDVTFHVGNFRGPKFLVSVTNLSSANEARDVRVRLTSSLPIILGGSNLPTVFVSSQITSTANKRNHGHVVFDYDRSEGVWFAGTVPPGAQKKTYIDYVSSRAPAARTGYDWFQADLLSSRPEEAPGLEGDNSSRQYLWQGGKAGVAGIEVGVRPDRKAGSDEVTGFTVRVADTRPGNLDLPQSAGVLQDVEVRIRLTGGLTYALNPTPPSGTTFNAATGLWRIPSPGREPKLLQLSVNPGAETPRRKQGVEAQIVSFIPNELCLRIIANTERCQNDAADNRASAYLEQAPVLTAEGEIDLFTYYPCTGVTDYPCHEANGGVALVAAYDYPSPPLKPWNRVIGTERFDEIVGTGGHAQTRTVLQPEEIVVHIPDITANRETNSGNTVWSTVNAVTLNIGQTAIDNSWDDFKESVTVSGAGGGPLPGRWRMVALDGSFDFLDAADSAKVEGTSYEHSLIPDDGLTGFKIWFATLGTYRAFLEIEATKTVSMTETKYTDTGTYTFHVGPIAELEVRDGGANPAVASGQRAYTIQAINNGPDAAPAVRVTLTGAPQGAEAVASQGSYAEGACQNGRCQGVWDIGELDAEDIRIVTGQGEGPTLTLITDDASAAPITAAIANTQDYTVCIGSDGFDIAAASEGACTATSGASWHSTAYYDHIPASNTATILARAGTGEGHPDAPSSLSLMPTPIGNILMWQRVEAVNGFAVTHYEVAYAEGGWKALKGDVTGIIYFDVTSSSGNRAYRVRAVNNLGVPGPWTVSSGGAALPPNVPRNFRAALVTDTDVELTWAAAEHGAALTHYIIQASDHAGGPWSQLARPNGDDTRWVHSNLPKTGATKFYRIRAHNSLTYSDWAEASVGLTTPPDDAAPTGLRAQRYTTREGNHGIQVWFTPSYTCALDATDCLTLIEFREVGSSAWRFGSENFGDYGIVPWDPDADYFTEGDGRRYAVRLDAAYDIRVCKLTEEQLEDKHKQGKAEGTWCVGHPTGQLRVPAGE